MTETIREAILMNPVTSDKQQLNLQGTSSLINIITSRDYACNLQIIDVFQCHINIPLQVEMSSALTTSDLENICRN